MSIYHGTHFVLGGIFEGSLMIYNGREFESVCTVRGPLPLIDLSRARIWKTRAGIERHIAAEKARGSEWQYVILPIPAA